MRDWLQGSQTDRTTIRRDAYTLGFFGRLTILGSITDKVDGHILEKPRSCGNEIMLRFMLYYSSSSFHRLYRA